MSEPPLPRHRVREIFERSVERDVSGELEFHLEMTARELESEGWEPAEARSEALRRFGDLERVSRECRRLTREHRSARNRINSLKELGRDLRFGVRTLRSRPAFAVAALLTLALGIGANAAIFSVVSGVLIEPLPYPEPERLMSLWEINQRGLEVNVSHPNFVDWKERAHSFASMALHSGSGGMVTILGGDSPLRGDVAMVSREFFSSFGVAPLEGRTLVDEDCHPGAEPVAVISYGFWQRALGGDPDWRERSLETYGKSLRVIGVMPPSFDFPLGAELWLPQELWPDTSSRDAHNWQVVARLLDGVGLSAALQEMSTLAAELQSEHAGDNDAFDVAVRELKEELVGSTRGPLLLLQLASGLVVVVACANLASSLLARAISRRREMVIRAAVGASRWQVVRQLLAEAMVLSSFGGALGLLLCLGLVRLLQRLQPEGLPRLEGVAIDLPVLAFAVGLSLITGVAFGLLPALLSTRGDLGVALAEGGKSGIGRRAKRAWTALVGAEVALTLILLLSAGLAVRSLLELMAVDPGFDPEGVLTLEVTVATPDLGPDAEREDYLESERWIADYYDRLFAALEGVPELESVAVTSRPPLAGYLPSGSFAFPDRPGEELGNAAYRVVSDRYFDTLGIPLIVGRAFDRRDHDESTHGALVSRQLAETYWPDSSPIGKRIRPIGMDLHVETPLEIVGVVGDVRLRGLDEEAERALYVSARQRARRAQYATLLVRGGGDPAMLAAALRRELARFDPTMPLEIGSLSARASGSLARKRFAAMLLGAFAVLALLLAITGVHGVVAYSVAERTREIGIRMALGAAPQRVVVGLVRRLLAVVAAGLVLGGVVFAVLSRAAQSLVYGISTTDPAVFAGVLLVLGGAAALAAYLPARRGTRLSPTAVLRQE